MNLDIARLKSTASNPDLSPEVRDGARQQLDAIAGRNFDPRSTDAKLALTEISTEAKSDTTEADNDFGKLLDMDLPTAIADFQTRQRAIYEEYKAEGLTGAGCVARLRQSGGFALSYGLIEADVQMCEKADKSALYRYHLPTLYGHLKNTPEYDWPARELGEATLAKYLPHEWLSRELFTEMAEMEFCLRDHTLSAESVKTRPSIDKIRLIKAAYPTSYGLIPDNLNSLVFSMMRS